MAVELGKLYKDGARKSGPVNERISRPLVERCHANSSSNRNHTNADIVVHE